MPWHAQDVVEIMHQDTGLAAMLPVRLAAQRHRKVSLLSKAHRQALTLLPALAVRLDWPEEPHAKGSIYDPAAALRWAASGELIWSIRNMLVAPCCLINQPVIELPT
jgi:hypothetical protein